MVKVYFWHDAPDEYFEKAKDAGLWSGGDEDYLLVGELEDEDLMDRLIDKLTVCDGEWKEIDGQLIGYTCHA